MRRFAVLFTMLCLFALPAAAQTHEMAHDMAHMDMAPQGNMAAPSSKAFNEANMKMHKDMSINFSGDTDADFVRGMIPHHQGAIDMAKVELQYGKDAELKKLANDIIAAQTTEIAMMNKWLAAHGK